MSRARLVLALFVVVGLVAVGCSGDDGADLTPTDEVPAEQAAEISEEGESDPTGDDGDSVPAQQASPEAVVEAYFEAADADDPEAMFALISPEIREELTLAEFTACVSEQLSPGVDIAFEHRQTSVGDGSTLVEAVIVLSEQGVGSVPSDDLEVGRYLVLLGVVEIDGRWWVTGNKGGESIFSCPRNGIHGQGTAGSEESGERDQDPLIDEEWTITLDAEGAGVHTVVMITTFRPLEEADIEDLGGRLVWDEVEVELCRIGIRSVGNGFVQVGDIFQTTEDCDGDLGMPQAFDEFGPPESACVFVRAGGVDDEYCAPLTVAISEIDFAGPVTPLEPFEASRFQSPTVTVEPFLLSPEALELFDGMLLSVPLDIVWEDGGRGWAQRAVRVGDGEASIMLGRYCGWDYEPALDAMDGSVLFDSGYGGGGVCTPGERYRPVPFWRALATARVEGRRLVLVAEDNGLRHLDLDSLESEPVLEVDFDRERPASASFGAGQWVVVMAESGAGPVDTRGRIVFVDPDGSIIGHEHNPFPEFGDEVGPRAAALADATTLIVAVEAPDGSTDLVSWDLRTGVELSRLDIIDRFVPGPDPYGFGREFVSSLDVSEGRVLVNVTVVAGEYLPAGALLVDPEGNVVDLSQAVIGAHFLED